MPTPRTIILSNGVEVSFDETSMIDFTLDNDGEFNMIRIDPTDLSMIYGAYRQMKQEIVEESKQ